MSLLTLGIMLLALLSPLPYATDRRLRGIPWVTYTLIAIHVIVYLWTGPFAGINNPIFLQWGLIPRPGQVGLSHAVLTLLSYSLLHTSFWHLFFNMAFLWLFGPHVEDALGRGAFLALYLGGVIAAGLLHIAIVLLIAPHSSVATEPLVGASGAISAILAPFAVRFHRSQIRMLWLPGLLAGSAWAQLEIPAVSGLAIWLLQSVVGAIKSAISPESGGVAYWAHLGGFAFGLVAAELTQLMRDGRQEYLLDDARGAAGRGYDALSVAVQKYRTFLDHDPNNASIRAELASVLAQRSEANDADRPEATTQMTAAVRLCRKRNDLISAVKYCREARSLGLSLPLSPRERLRLGSAAEEEGDLETALALLQAIVAETPQAPEDEMARLKLGQWLLPRRPVEARALLTSFTEKYPQSQWVVRARELREQAGRAL